MTPPCYHYGYGFQSGLLKPDRLYGEREQQLAVGEVRGGTFTIQKIRRNGKPGFQGACVAGGLGRVGGGGGGNRAPENWGSGGSGKGAPLAGPLTSHRLEAEGPTIFSVGFDDQYFCALNTGHMMLFLNPVTH